MRYNPYMNPCDLIPSRAARPWTFWLALLLAALLGLAGCSTAPPPGLVAVTPFDVNRYAGKWYEIARMDHSFERGLSDVSATYRLQPDGSVQVVNRGFDTARKDWKEAVGKALFTGDSNRGALKVSFFGPFYGGYNVVALDPDYRWSLVVGRTWAMSGFWRATSSSPPRFASRCWPRRASSASRSSRRSGSRRRGPTPSIHWAAGPPIISGP
jgi:lipocalin